MAESRTLKLSILADVDGLRKNLKQGETQVSGFGDKIGKFGKIAATGFAVAGAAAAAYAGKLLVDGVKSAIEDEKAQASLAKTLQNVTKATDAQIAATEDYITKTALATGVGDDELRPSLDRLIRSFGSVAKAQDAQTLALDVAAGSGKSLQQVSEALAKAHDGQFTALRKLGVPLDENIVKSKDYDAAVAALTDTFGGQAAAAADTFDGKLSRLTVAFDEAKETVGSYVLDALDPLSGALLDNVLPALGGAAYKLGKDLAPAFAALKKFAVEDLLPAITSLWEEFQKYILPTFQTVFQAIQRELVPGLQKLWEWVSRYIVPAVKSLLIPAFQAIQEGVKKIQKAFEDNRPQLEAFGEIVRTVVGFIIEKAAPVLGAIFGAALKFLFDNFVRLIGVVGWLSERFVTLWGWGKRAVEIFGNLKEGAGDVLKFLRDKFGQVFNFLTAPFRKAFELIAKLWNMTIGKLSWTVPDWVPVIGGNTISAPKLPETLPMLADGGIVTRPTVAMIGERGAEAVIPLNQLGRYGGGITINVSGALDPEAVARQIQNIMRRSQLRAGALA